MLQIAKRFVTTVDRVNYRIGRVMMYFIFVMIGILLWSSISKTFFLPSLWTLEIAQFAMVAYYIMGGPYSIQMGSNCSTTNGPTKPRPGLIPSPSFF
jgi:TRAP-type C4-dicarboxylate transport system permease small subunit